MVEKEIAKMNPVQALMRHWDDAIYQADSHAFLCSLATVNAEGFPSVRTLMLRDISVSSIDLFCHRSSQKYQDIESNGKYELLFYWGAIKIQYRIRGSWSLLPRSDLEKSWVQQPDSSKLLDHFLDRMAEGSVIGSIDVLHAGVEALRQSFEGKEIDMPSSAIGLRLHPFRIERLEINEESRIHERWLFELVDDEWLSSLLVP